MTQGCKGNSTGPEPLYEIMYSRFSEQDSSNFIFGRGIATLKFTGDGFVVDTLVGGGRRFVGTYSNSERSEAEVTVTSLAFPNDEGWENCRLRDETSTKTTSRITDDDGVNDFIKIGPYYIEWCDPGHIWRERMSVGIGGPIVDSN